MLAAYVKKIRAARVVYNIAIESPLTDAPNLSKRLGSNVLLKREDLQPIFSFKLRGAYNKMVRLGDVDGVIAASAGNHAQGVALAASELGLKATIVMGLNTPDIKVSAVREYGANVVLHGDTYDDAARHASEIATETGLSVIHPYDDPEVIAGQGTVGMEILNDYKDCIHAVFVPVGGGGLIAGIGAYIKHLSPEIKVIGVEAQGSDCLRAAMSAGRRVRLPADELDLFADGVSVAQIGKETFKIARRCVDEVIVVNTDEICAAIKDIFDDTRSLAEPAGALAVAGMKKYLEGGESKTGAMVAVVSGANVNFDRLRHISERAEVGEHHEAVFGVTIPEQPGSFRRLCRSLGKRSITEFNYRVGSSNGAHVFLGVRIERDQDRRQIKELLVDDGYSVDDMTDNEMAKLHVRHMVGGSGSVSARELLYRFEFPERPGALLQFLLGLGSDWNITLFHYRNHGSAWGRVLVGFEGGGSDRESLSKYLGHIGYRYWEESGNPAYQLFLRGD